MAQAAVDFLIKNVTLVTPKGVFADQSIAINQGLISSLGKTVLAKEIVDGKGLLAMAGIVDSHVHCREPGDVHKEDFISFSRAAMMGGITSVIDMPNSTPAVTSDALLRAKMDCARGKFFCDHAFYLGASPTNWHSLAAWERTAGCAGIKLFMGSSTGDLLVEDDDTIGKILASGSSLVAVHAEDEPRLRARAHYRQEGEARSHSVWRDEEAAVLACQRLMNLAKKHAPTRPLHILHISTKGEVETIRAAQKQGVNVTMEVTPHHLFFCEDDYQQLQTRVVVNPPLRAAHHRKFLWQAVKKGWLDTVGSDHAPHTLQEKDNSYPDAPSGVPTAGLLLPLMMQLHKEGLCSLPDLTRMMAANPAARYHLSGKGLLKEGYDADIVLVDAKKTHRVDCSDPWQMRFFGKGMWSPYEGYELTGWPRMVFLRGVKMMEDGICARNKIPYGALLSFSEKEAIL